ncbi:glutaminyl-peptide cyclotransferase [Salinisphaera aquimarina]|uniref:Glutaminyl-peptide cyclotransferase n=1 Tax=Salinisphaera aquimarina TaxID=2094031 RepID=A0ABV7EM66_9GAMM
MNKGIRGLIVAVLLGATTACSASIVPAEPARILAAYPHDADAFTQGLLVDRGEMFESTGQYGQSSLRRVDLESGRILQAVSLPAEYFGEGLALADGRLYQLTWKAGVVFIYDRNSLERLGELHYSGEGWGLTWDGHHLIMSDGSAALRVIDRQDFSVVGRIAVTEQGRPLDNLNELEYIDGGIWANVWHQSRIVRIDPVSGQVTRAIDATALKASLPRDATPNVLNGIAWDAAQERLYLTGKYWPRLFEIARASGDAAASNH